MSKKSPLTNLMSLCKRRGFISPSCEMYNGLAGAFDYGPLGTELKRKISNLWWQDFVSSKSNCFGVDTPILLPPKVWQVAGHTEHFADIVIDCKHCGHASRFDHVIEQFQEKSKQLSNVDNSINSQTTIFNENRSKLQCLHCNRRDCFDGEPVSRNLMFKTHVGSNKSGTDTFLRPETAQGIFMAYKDVVDTMRPTLPFGIGQIGKAFRNEANPSHFTFRMREFEQLELEYFCTAEQVPAALDLWLNDTMRFVQHRLGLPSDRLRRRVQKRAGSESNNADDDELAVEGAHYAQDGGFDVEYRFAFGWAELCGIANRGTHDTALHGLRPHDKDGGAKAPHPHVVEPSFGLDRLVLATLDAAWQPALSSTDQQSGEQVTRDVLQLPYPLAPVKLAILPLMKQSKFTETARDIYKRLQPLGNVEYDETGSIGKRYRRQDEIGTPTCVTIDAQTLTDSTVTIRDRDTMTQERVTIETLKNAPQFQ